MEPIEIGGNLLILIFAIANLEGVKLTPQGTDTAADAPPLVDNRYIRLKFDSLHRANVDTRATAGTMLRQGFAGKVDRHQIIPEDLSAPDRTDIPTGATAAVAIVHHLAGSIINKMNQPGFSRSANYVAGRSACYWPAQPALYQKISHLIEFEANLARVLAGSAHQISLHPAGAMGNRKARRVVKHSVHMIVGHNCLHRRV